ncbi:MAG TPA: ribose-phosphate pyrophosphokinase [Anaeromyxobacteraceae bacterium]|nr:ribose-phosphate pyrophosphokinase [Anaeromyxobacteraceae bacterium]
MTVSNGHNGHRPALDYRVFSGNSNRPLAEAIAASLGRPLAKATVGRFSDGEIQVEIGENVRGMDTFVIQSTSPDANMNLMELLIMIDALKRASASSIVAVIPYYGYARQDRKVASRSPISAKLVADLIETAGATRVVSMDMHAGQIQGFFDVPFDHLYAAPVLLEHMRRRFDGDAEDVVIVSPDAGGVERARAYSKRLGSTLGIVDKRRTNPNVAEIMNVIGEVQGKIAVLLDDMIDTAGTLTQAANALIDKGAARVYAYATHAVLSGPAVERIAKSPIDEVVVTNTIPLAPAAVACNKIRSLSVAGLLAEAIRRIHEADSLSSLFV